MGAPLRLTIFKKTNLIGGIEYFLQKSNQMTQN